MYLASAIDFAGGVVPCKVVPSLFPKTCWVPYQGMEVHHAGCYDLLPFVPELMEFVESYQGAVPPGRRAISGGHEDARPLFHAIAQINGFWTPGKAAPQLV